MLFCNPLGAAGQVLVSLLLRLLRQLLSLHCADSITLCLGLRKRSLLHVCDQRGRSGNGGACAVDGSATHLRTYLPLLHACSFATADLAAA